jgi:CheY-like chemotaxis protein
MNGLNACQRIKQILPKVKLIFLTVNEIQLSWLRHSARERRATW